MSRSKEGHSRTNHKNHKSAIATGSLLAVALLVVAAFAMRGDSGRDTPANASLTRPTAPHTLPSRPVPPPPPPPSSSAQPTPAPTAPEPQPVYTAAPEPPQRTQWPSTRPYTPPAPVMAKTDIQRYAQSLIADSNQFACLANIVQRESGWNPHAGNSDGSYGVPQALPGDKMSSEGADWRDNPQTQLRWMVKYIHSRYGTPCGAWAFWQGHSWY